MNLVEELQSLDVNDVGRWPLAFRAAVIAIVFVVVLGMGVYLFIIEDKAPQLQRAQEEEQTLRVSFENKQKKAANYDAYKAQLTEMEQSFGTMLRQLPGKTEIPSLIVDISQTGLAAGLGPLLVRVAGPDPDLRPVLHDLHEAVADPGIRRCRSGTHDDTSTGIAWAGKVSRIVCRIGSSLPLDTPWPGPRRDPHRGAVDDPE